MKRFSIPPREERERHSHTMSAYLEFDSISYRKISRSIYYPRTYELCSAFKLTVSRRETVGSAV